MFFYWLLVWPVETVKRLTGARTWYVEVAFIVTVLSGVAFFTQRPWMEWIAVAAVTLTFCHANVANRLEEMEGERVRAGGKASVECYPWLQRHFYAKEALWFMYFLLIGAYPALMGVVIFLLFGKWRVLWRRYHPIQEKSE
jgi:hypothetical protein